jgi:hypothetical protein
MKQADLTARLFYLTAILNKERGLSVERDNMQLLNGAFRVSELSRLE